MKGISFRFRQKGNFAIEFSFVGLLLGVLLAFAQDAIIKISTKGKLDRLSYSAVSLVKERTQLYNCNYDPDDSGYGSDSYCPFELNNPIKAEDVVSLYTVVKNSLERTTGSFDVDKFGMRLEEQTYDEDTNTPNTLKVFNCYGDAAACAVGETTPSCSVEQSLTGTKESDLRITTTLNRNPPLYRITLCYETDDLVAGLLSSGFKNVSSTSVAVGR
jgi:tight adherence protein F